MPAKASPRNHRNNPYVLDGWAVRVHHSAAETIWRFRAEMITLTAAKAGFWALHRAVHWVWAAVILAALVLVVLALPWSRPVHHPASLGTTWGPHAMHAAGQSACHHTKRSPSLTGPTSENA